MVFAVYMPAHEPVVGHAARSICSSSSSLTVPLLCAPTASNTSWIVMSRPWYVPGRIVPPYRYTEARFNRAIAISMAGSDLSQPAIPTSASNRSACITSSTESAITSRLISDAFIPS